MALNTPLVSGRAVERGEKDRHGPRVRRNPYGFPRECLRPLASIPTERERANALMPLAPLASYHSSMCFCVSSFIVAESVHFYGNTFKMPVSIPVHFHQLSDCPISQNRPCTGAFPPHNVDEPSATFLVYHPYPFTSFPDTPLHLIANFSPAITPSL